MQTPRLPGNSPRKQVRIKIGTNKDEVCTEKSSCSFLIPDEIKPSPKIRRWGIKRTCRKWLFKNYQNIQTTPWWFKVPFLRWLSDLMERLGDLQLGDKRVTLNHLGTWWVVYLFNYYYLVMDFPHWWMKWPLRVIFSQESTVMRVNQGHPFWGILYPWPPQPELTWNKPQNNCTKDIGGSHVQTRAISGYILCEIGERISAHRQEMYPSLLNKSSTSQICLDSLPMECLEWQRQGQDVQQQRLKLLSARHWDP